MLIASGRTLLTLLFLGFVETTTAMTALTDRTALTTSLQKIADDYLAANVPDR